MEKLRSCTRAAVVVGIVGLAFFTAGASAIITVTVGPNINVTALSGNQAEATIAVDPTNPQRLFEASNPGTTASVSSNGGASWTRFSIGTGGAGDGLPVSCCDNVAVYDQFGNLFLVYIGVGANPAVPSGDETIELALSTTGGTPGSFSIIQQIDPPGPVDQPTVAVGPNSVWVTWNRGGTIFARGAAVTGLGTVGAFSAAQAAPGSNAVGGQFGDIAVGPAGQVTVTYQTNTQIYVNTDADGLGAGGFGAQVLVTATNVAKFDAIPAQSGRTIDAEAGLAYDSSGGGFNGRLYMVYTDEQPDESNDTDVLLRISNDNGANWSAPLQVNDDAGTNSQFLPHLGIDQTTGWIGVTWYDARNDAGGGGPGDTNSVANDDAQFWGAFSTNGGASFMPNFQISTGTSNAAAAGSGVDYGDYSWSGFTGGFLYPAWSDNSNSTGDNPDGTLSRFDIYTAQVRIVDNLPPTVTADDASGDEGAAVPVGGTVSDPNGDPLTTVWTYAPGGGVDPGATCAFAAPGSVSTTISCTDDGSYVLTLTADDGVNAPVADTATLTLANVDPSASITSPTSGEIIQLADPVNLTAPFTDAGANDTHTCSIDWGDTTVEAGAIVEAAGAGTCSGSHTYSLGGMKTITVTVTDDDGGSDTVSVTIDINTPPDCTPVTPSTDTLWPPDHKLVLVSIGGATDADGDTVTLTIDSVTQDESLDGLGDGDTSPDATPGGTSNEVNLRAERSGTGDGRVYRIAFTGDDGRGGSCTGTVFVGVPHEKKKGSTAVDSGLVVNSFG